MKSIRQKLVFAVTAVAAMIGAVDPVRADFLFQNLVTEGSYTPNVGGTINTVNSPLIHFTATGTGNVSEVKAAIWEAAGKSVTLTLTDSSNQVLESWTGTPPEYDYPNSVAVWDLTSVLHPLLIAGHQYTLTASTTSLTGSAAWEEGSNSLHHGTGLGNNPGNAGGVDILSGSSGGNTVPEPSSFALFGLGGLALVARAIGRGKSTV